MNIEKNSSETFVYYLSWLIWSDMQVVGKG